MSAAYFFERLENCRPSAWSIHHAAYLRCLVAHALQIAMLQFDPRAAVALGDESNFHLRDKLGIELPISTQLPSEHQSLRWQPLDDIACLTGRAILPNCVPASANARLNDILFQGRLESRVGGGPPARHFVGE